MPGYVAAYLQEQAQRDLTDEWMRDCECESEDPEDLEDDYDDIERDRPYGGPDQPAIHHVYSPDGAFYESYVPPGYIGHCRLKVDGCGGSEEAIFPDQDSAEGAAAYAVRPDYGGYFSAAVVPAPREKVTHRSMAEWACD